MIDGSDWRLDPLNPRQVTGGFGPNSELVMPGWPGAGCDVKARVNGHNHWRLRTKRV